MEHGEKFQREFKNRPRALEMLYGLVTDLFVDKHKFKGHNVRGTTHFAIDCARQGIGGDAVVTYSCCLARHTPLLHTLVQQVQHKIPQLLELLERYDFETIVRYFNEPA